MRIVKDNLMRRDGAPVDCRIAVNGGVKQEALSSRSDERITSLGLRRFDGPVVYAVKFGLLHPENGVQFPAGPSYLFHYSMVVKWSF